MLGFVFWKGRGGKHYATLGQPQGRELRVFSLGFRWFNVGFCLSPSLPLPPLSLVRHRSAAFGTLRVHRLLGFRAPFRDL